MKWLYSKNFASTRKSIEEEILSAFPDAKSLSDSEIIADLDWDNFNFIGILFQGLEKGLKQQKPTRATSKTTKNNDAALYFYNKSKKYAARGSSEVCRRKIEDGRICNCCAMSLKEFEQAVKAVTIGIANAVPDTLEMSLGYKLKARYLYNLNYLEECLVDLDRIQLDKLELKAQFEVHSLRAECFERLSEQNLKQSKLFLHKMPLNDSSLPSMRKMLKKYPSKEYPKPIVEYIALNEIKSPNENFPCASDAIKVSYSEEFGRHIVATRDIDVGELLVVEEPHNKMMALENCFSHCWHCLRATWNGIPCDNCVNVIYCSEKCKATDWSIFHNLECTLLDLLFKLDKDLSQCWWVD